MSSRGAILVLNGGSSSLKFSLFEQRTGPMELAVRGQAEQLLTTPHFVARDKAGHTLVEHRWAQAKLDHEQATEFLLQWLANHRAGEKLTAAGHRVVHGGQRFVESILVDQQVIDDLEKLIPLAPLHQPHNVSAIKALAKLAPSLPQVCCFDTAFHRRMPALAQAFALPRQFSAEGVVRYGFHGLSFEYIASILPEIDPRLAAGRVIVAHLGNGASLCAMRNGMSVATTMSFTPLDGLVMGSRCGSLDPGVVLYLLQSQKMQPAELQQMLYEKSGLLGISQISSDMRTLLASTDPRAREAIDLFVYRVGREIGSLAAALQGLDALVFTGGIGENAAPIRAAICRSAAWLGIQLDDAANNQSMQKISTPDTPASAWIIPTNEELVIARHTASIIDKKHAS
jgi:acetate kinase